MSAYSAHPIRLDRETWQQALVQREGVLRSDCVEIWVDGICLHKFPLFAVMYSDKVHWEFGNIRVVAKIGLGSVEDDFFDLGEALGYSPVLVKIPFYLNLFELESSRFGRKNGVLKLVLKLE